MRHCILLVSNVECKSTHPASDAEMLAVTSP